MWHTFTFSKNQDRVKFPKFNHLESFVNCYTTHCFMHVPFYRVDYITHTAQELVVAFNDYTTFLQCSYIYIEFLYFRVVCLW